MQSLLLGLLGIFLLSLLLVLVTYLDKTDQIEIEDVIGNLEKEYKKAKVN